MERGGADPTTGRPFKTGPHSFLRRSGMKRAALILLGSLAPLPLGACEVALVLALDVSRSVDAREFDLMRHGTAQAFRHNSVQELITWMEGGLFVTVTEWSGPEQQRQIVPWRHLTDADGAHAFADETDAVKRVFRYDMTAPGEALSHAGALFDSLPQPCSRFVIDIAGDGVRNSGRDVEAVTNALAARDITINGLVVRGDTPDPLSFYQTEIQRGPLSFVEISDGYDDFPNAILRKLLRELSPILSALPSPVIRQ